MSKLLINERPLVVQPSLAKAIGLNEAIVLQQIQYWISNEKVGVWKDGYKWVHNSYPEWAKNFPFWSESGVKKIILRLESMGLLISDQFAPNPYDHTKAYRINEEELDLILGREVRRPGSDDTPDSTPEVRSLHRLLPETTNTGDRQSSSVPESFPIGWKIAAGEQITSMPDENLQRYKDAAWVIGGSNKAIYDLAYTFQVKRGLELPVEDAKYNRKEANKMVKAKVTPEILAEAIQYMADKNLNCVKLGSVSSIAIGIANPAQKDDFWSKPGKFEGV